MTLLIESPALIGLLNLVGHKYSLRGTVRPGHGDHLQKVLHQNRITVTQQLSWKDGLCFSLLIILRYWYSLYLKRRWAISGAWKLDFSGKLSFLAFSFLATPQHMEFPGQGSDPSSSCYLRQRQILNPLYQAKDQTCIPALKRYLWSPCATAETP